MEFSKVIKQTGYAKQKTKLFNIKCNQFTSKVIWLGNSLNLFYIIQSLHWAYQTIYLTVLNYCKVKVNVDLYSASS